MTPPLYTARGDADNHYGVCVIPTGDKTIQQDFAVVGVRAFTVSLSVKAVGADLSGSNATLSILDGDGNTIVTANLSGAADTWTDNAFNYGLAEGTTYSLIIKNRNASGDIRIDDLWFWFVPLTRLQIAQRVHAKLGRLATDRGLNTTPSGSQTEGSYTYAVDAGLRILAKAAGLFLNRLTSMFPRQSLLSRFKCASPAVTRRIIPLVC